MNTFPNIPWFSLSSLSGGTPWLTFSIDLLSGNGALLSVVLNAYVSECCTTRKIYPNSSSFCYAPAKNPAPLPTQYCTSSKSCNCANIQRHTIRHSCLCCFSHCYYCCSCTLENLLTVCHLNCAPQIAAAAFVEAVLVFSCYRTFIVHAGITFRRSCTDFGFLPPSLPLLYLFLPRSFSLSYFYCRHHTPQLLCLYCCCFICVPWGFFSLTPNFLFL